MSEQIDDMEVSCRVCLHVGMVMVDIYEEVEDLKTDLSKLLEQCGGLKVLKDDSYPKYLCKECTTELLIAANFRIKCARTKEILDQVEAELDAAKSQEDSLEAEANAAKDAENDFSENNEKEEGEVNIVDVEAAEPELDENVITMEEKDSSQYEEHLEEIAIENTDDLTEDMTDAIIEEVPEETTAEEFNSIMHNDEDMDSDKNAADEEDDTAEVNFSNALNEDMIIFACDDTTSYTIENDILFNDVNEEEVESSNFVQPKVGENAQIEEGYAATNSDQFVCDVCGALFMHAENLKRHMDRSHLMVERFVCLKCDHCFSFEEQYRRHCNSCDRIKLPVSKTSCDNVGKKKRANVLQECSTKTEHRCSYCGKVFQGLFALNMHVRTHTGERPYSCEYCAKSYKTQSALTMHLKRHTSQPDFACNICKKTFYETSNLNAHMRIHTGDKPHKCTICGRGFTRVFLLQIHMRTHTGEKPYQCQQCDRAFAQSCDLKNHYRTHTKERSYKCPICPKTFIKRYPMTLHMKKHYALGIDVEDAIQRNLVYTGNDQQLIDEAVATITEDYSSGLTDNELLTHDISLTDLIEDDL